jgi:hypothetical protein
MPGGLSAGFATSQIVPAPSARPKLATLDLEGTIILARGLRLILE